MITIRARNKGREKKCLLVIIVPFSKLNARQQNISHIYIYIYYCTWISHYTAPLVLKNLLDSTFPIMEFTFRFMITHSLHFVTLLRFLPPVGLYFCVCSILASGIYSASFRIHENGTKCIKRIF